LVPLVGMPLLHGLAFLLVTLLSRLAFCLMPLLDCGVCRQGSGS